MRGPDEGKDQRLTGRVSRKAASPTRTAGTVFHNQLNALPARR